MVAAAVAQGAEFAFPANEYLRRQNAARALLQERGIDVLIVTGPENIFYLTGQQTPGYYTFQALLLAADGDDVFIVRQLEYFNLVSNSYLTRIVTYQDGDDPISVLGDVVQKRAWQNRRLAVEKRGWFLSIAVYEALASKLNGVADGSRIIESLRVVKSRFEIEKIERAARYVDAGMRAGLDAVKAGATENDLVAAMMGHAIAAGSEYVGMEPLVSSGPRTGVPHGTWRRRVIRPGDPVFLELAACHDRYHAALMRSAWIGPAPAHARKMMLVCEEALAEALRAVRPGATCESVHAACQAVIDRHGYTESFRKRTGYSIGISFAPDWGEGHILSLYSGVHDELEPGMTFHIPPALRVYGELTVGVSETIVVTENGYRRLSTIDGALLEVRAAGS